MLSFPLCCSTLGVSHRIWPFVRDTDTSRIHHHSSSSAQAVKAATQAAASVTSSKGLLPLGKDL